MEYRQLGRTGLWVSTIGLGTEHLEQSREAMEAVVGRAVAAGVNYVDLLYSDPQEAAAFWDPFAEVLAPHRDRLILAAHWGPSHVKDVDRCQHSLEDVLERVNGYAEIAILAVVDSLKQWKGWVPEAAERLQRLKEQGRVGYIGLSGHFAATLAKVVESGLVDVLMYPINMVWEPGPSQELCHLCASRGVGLVAMKAFAGGELFQREVPVSPLRCLGYTLSQPGVATTLVGVNNVAELERDLAFFTAAEGEKDFAPLIQDLQRGREGTCVYCNHCLPCPARIDVGAMLRLYATARRGLSEQLQAEYDALPARASDCVECGECVERCPFGVDVVGAMRMGALLFGELYSEP